MQRLTLTRPDDWHVHLRDGEALATTVPATAATFARAIVMPNLRPPVTTTEHALAYRARISEAVPRGSRFEPLMTLYLTDETSPDEIRRAKASGVIHGVKLYPMGATTHSDAGVTDLTGTYPTLETMAAEGLPLLVHAEVVDPDVDIFDRERVFLERELAPVIARFPELRVVVEHVTTEEAVAFVSAASPAVAATITAHHLLLNRNALLAGGIWPHHYCLPVLKRERHRQALLAAATGGNAKFFLGTDSAPHPKTAKETVCGCAGIFTAPMALALYAEAFEEAGALPALEAFASHHGADFYGLPRNTETVTLQRHPQAWPTEMPFGKQAVVPFRAGLQTSWSADA